MTEPDPGTPRLTVVTPEAMAGQVIPLPAGELVIGHSETADIVLDDRFVSRRHAIVSVEAAGQVTIRDLNSTGGTFVNERRIDGPRTLAAGDVVRFADLTARFEPARSEPGQAPPPGGPPSAGDETAEGGQVYSVTGRVLSPALPGIGGLTVRLADKNVGGDQVLATATTQPDGSFAFSLPIGAAYLARHHKAEPDLQVSAVADGAVLASSPVSYSAPAAIALDIVLPAGASGIPSEYDTLTANLAAAYPGRLGALREDAGQQDITFLANKTGWDARAVALAALADQFSQITAPAPVTEAEAGQTATWPQPTVSVAPEFYYALFRAGVPASPDGLFRTSPATARQIWTQAAAAGVIPPALADQVPAATASFQVIAAARSLDAPPPAGVSTLREMLAPVLPEPAQQSTFAGLYAQHQGDWPALWEAAGRELGAQAADRLRLAGQLYYLTANNAPLVSALLDAEAAGSLTSALDLAARGYYEPAAWAPLIGGSVPPQIPGDGDAARAANYAALLAAQVRLSYPTAVVADQVRRAVVPVTGPAEVTRGVADFLAERQADFAIGVEPIDQYLARTGRTDVPAPVTAAIKQIQRVYQLTPDDASMAVLLRHNLDSAFAITRFDAAGFTRAFAGQLGGADNAAAIHARARQVFATTLSVALQYRSALVSPSLGGGTPVKYGNPPPAAPPDFPVTAYPTLEGLFGSLDYCGCTDCGSILSPAAYLVDLLNYIDQPAPSGGLANPQDVLLARRPDLEYLPLTCANTNTALPYIDLVNELLEYVVANGLTIDGYQGHDTPDTVTSAELIASPQNVNDAAYEVLRGAFFPPPLPFNRPLELLRRHLGALGVALPDAMATLRASDALTDASTPASYGWNDIAIEQLTISREECRIFTDPALRLSDLFGLPAPVPPATEQQTLQTLQDTSIADFSRRLGVSYDDLIAIVGTQFINPNAALIPRLTALHASFATLAQLKATIGTPDSIAADFIAALPAGLDATEYGGATPTDYQAVIDWVTGQDNYQSIMSIIVITDPAGGTGDCSGAALRLRYANPDPQANLLSGTDFVKLIRFVRLWRTLAPLLGDPGDAEAIAQTDHLLTALYPAGATYQLVDPADPANDAANRPRLDAGFAVTLPRAGLLLRVLGALSLTADAALDQLLACWAPIGTGAGSLYERLFLTPALLQQDPGAQTATVSRTVNAGDVLHTVINGAEEIPGVTVAPGQDAAAVAAAIAHAINASTAPDLPDPVSGQQLGSRFLASVPAGGNVVTIRAGFTLDCSVSAGATGSCTAAAGGTPVSRGATVAGPLTPGDILTTTFNQSLPVSYQVQPGDTPATAAAGIATAVNATTVADPWSGLPLNGLVVAGSAPGSPEVTFTAADAGAPFSLACSLDPAGAGSYQAAAPVPARCTASVTGAAAPGDVLVTTIDSVPVSYTATPADTDPATLAANIAATINAAVAAVTDPSLPQLPLNQVVTAASAGSVVTITAADPSTPVSVACQAPPGDGYVAAGPAPESVAVTVAGSIPAGTTLTTTINTVPIWYLTQPGDSPASIAAAIAGLITAAAVVDPVTGLPLNAVVTAAAAAGTVTVTGTSPTTPFTLSTDMSAAGYTAGQAAPAFADDGYGGYLTDPAQTLFGHEPTICAACNLTSAEFAQIAAALGFGPGTPLTLANVSAVFRNGWLAHALSLSVAEFLLLTGWTGLDPFGTLDPAPTAPAEPAVIRFIRLLGTLQQAGLTTSAALYLIWNTDITGTSAPPAETITGLALALAADFAAVEAQFAIAADPDGSIAQGLMTLVYGATASAYFFGLLDGTVTTSVPYAAPAGVTALPPQVTAAAAGRLGYDDLARQLTFGGLLDPATEAALAAAAAADAPDPAALTAAIASLAAASRQAAAPFFAAYPELEPLYSAYAASPGPVADRRTALLASILPTLKRQRKQEQALAAVTAAAGTDPAFATALLADPAVLHADADAAQPGIADLMAIESQGLSARFYLANDPTAPPDQVIDAVPALSYAQTATIGGGITAGDVLTTTINGQPVPYQVAGTEADLAALAAGVAAAISAATVTDPVSGLPVGQVVAASAQPAAGVIAIRGRDPSGRYGAFTLACSVSAGATETYAAGTELPAGTGGSAIAAVWSGYLTVPQDGYYDIDVAADDGAAITLEIGGAVVGGTAAGGLWSNAGPISLTAGELVPIALTASSVRTTLSVSWQSQGLGWQPIGAQYLYPANLVARLGDTYVRFLKATALAADLSLTAAEIAGLGTAAGFSVGTSCGSVTAPGPAVFTPAAMGNIAAGSVLVIDEGAAQEIVTVTGVTATTFSAVTALAHDGSAAPFPVVGAAFPQAGEGWLNYLTGAGWLPGAGPAGPGQATAASLGVTLQQIADFAVMKQALSPSDARLLAVLRSPAATLPVTATAAPPQAAAIPVVNSALLSLTGWERNSVNALLTRFFGSADPAPLTSVANLRRVYDAYALLRTCRLSAPALCSAITNAPTPATVSALQSALRAQYSPDDWLTAIRPISDQARISQRDALVGYVLQRLGDGYAASLVTLPVSADAGTGGMTLAFAATAAVTEGMSVQAPAVAPGTTAVQVTTAGGTTTVTLGSGLLGAVPAGSQVTFVPAGAVAIATPDDLYQYFLLDTQNQPAVLTSRILLALSTTQLFVERVLRNLEPSVAPADIDQQMWAWMRRYRVWQANREVFLWPENWLYPELRDDQSPIFQQAMSDLLQGDITDDSAASACLGYLTGLEEVAKLEPCGLYYVPASADADETCYVLARTAGAHRKYYFRQLSSGSWSPWAQAQIDCEDMPVTPVVWNGRLFLFWLKASKQSAPPGTKLSSSAKSPEMASMHVDDVNTFASNARQAGSAGSVQAGAVLCWSEFCNGAWQAAKTSDVNQPTSVGAFDPAGPGSLESCRNLIRIVPARFTGLRLSDPFYGASFDLPDDALILAITVNGSANYSGGFILHNTHSLPTRLEDTSLYYTRLIGSLGHYERVTVPVPLLPHLTPPSPSRVLSPAITPPYTGGYAPGTFGIDYLAAAGAKPSYSESLITFAWQPRWIEPQPWLPDPWGAPFIYEDRRHLFYVVTTQSWVPVRAVAMFGMLAQGGGTAGRAAQIPSLVLREAVVAPTPREIFAVNATAGDPSAVQRYLSQDTDLSAALPAQLAVTYQGQVITPIGSLAALTQRPDAGQAPGTGAEGE